MSLFLRKNAGTHTEPLPQQKTVLPKLILVTLRLDRDFEPVEESYVLKIFDYKSLNLVLNSKGDMHGRYILADVLRTSYFVNLLSNCDITICNQDGKLLISQEGNKEPVDRCFKVLDRTYKIALENQCFGTIEEMKIDIN